VFSLDIKVSTGARGSFPALWIMSFININCRRHLADFFRMVQNTPARWLSIISNENGCDEGNIGSLFSFLGMSYNDLYLPFMMSCGLIRRTTSNRLKTTKFSPSIDGVDYTWENFFSEFLLDLEVSYLYLPNSKGGKTKLYYIRVGKFKDEVPRFTVLEQMRSTKKIAIRGVRRTQERLIKSFAREAPSSFHIQSNIQSDADKEAADMRYKEIGSQTLAPAMHMGNANHNLRLIVQNHFFDGILKPGVNADKLWDLIDETKLREGISEFVKAFHASRYETHQKVMSETLQCTSCNNEAIDLNGKAATEFPSLYQYGIPMVKSCLQAVLRDVYLVSQSAVAGTNVLTFQLFNESTCSLMSIPSSADYDRFKRNARRTKWIDKLLRLNAAEEVEVEEGVTWLLRYLGEKYSDLFTAVAVQLGLLLAPKVMDSESACAMWEEANCPVRAQRIILRHLKHFFGRRITVPEHQLRDLEEGALLPTCNSVLINNSKMYFWHRNIDEAVVHRLKTEVRCRGLTFLSQFNMLDIIFGGDHGARRFRAVIQLILRNKDNGEVEPYSIVITVANIDCQKDTRQVLEATVGIPLNESLKRIVGKFIFISPETISLMDEQLPDLGRPEESILMESRAFIAGDLSFFATILGKENMAGSWCTWCTLSKAQWSAADHPIGEPWTIEKILDIRRNVEENNLCEVPENIKGCTAKPLFDAVPVCNYILSILHIIIGIGNSLVDGLFEWVEERIEKLTDPEIQARNSVLFAEVQYERLKEDYDHWLENDGLDLVDKQLNKNFLNDCFREKVGTVTVILFIFACFPI